MYVFSIELMISNFSSEQVVGIKSLLRALENLKDGQRAVRSLTRYARGFGLLFRTRTRFMNESSSGLQRRDKLRRTFRNRDQFNTIGTVFRVVAFPSRSGGERFTNRSRA